MACACEGVPIPNHNARVAIEHHEFSTGTPTFSLLHESIQYFCHPSRESSAPGSHREEDARIDAISPDSTLQPVRERRELGSPSTLPSHARDRSLGFTLEFTLPGGLSWPPFARCAAFSALVPRSFSLWAQL